MTQYGAGGPPVTAAQLNAMMPVLLGRQAYNFSSGSIAVPIASGYNFLQCMWTGRQDTGSGGAFCFVRFNGDSGNNYTWQDVLGNGGTASASNAGAGVNGVRVGVIPGSGDAAGYFGGGCFFVGNASATGTGAYKPVTAPFQGPVTASNGYAGTHGGLWAGTAAITTVTLWPTSGNLVAGSSLSVYGWQ